MEFEELKRVRTLGQLLVTGVTQFGVSIYLTSLSRIKTVECQSCQFSTHTLLLVAKMNVAFHEASRYVDVLVEIEDECKASSAVI